MSINRFIYLLSLMCLTFVCVLTSAQHAQATSYSQCAVSEEEQVDGYRCPAWVSFQEVGLTAQPVNNFAWSGFLVRMSDNFLDRTAGERIENVQVSGEAQTYETCSKRNPDVSTWHEPAFEVDADWSFHNGKLRVSSTFPNNAHRWLGTSHPSKWKSTSLKRSLCRLGLKGSFDNVVISTDKRQIYIEGSARLKSVEMIWFEAIRTQVVEVRARLLKRHRLRLAVGVKSDKSACTRNRTVVFSMPGFRTVRVQSSGRTARITLPVLPLKSSHIGIRVKREWRNGFLCRAAAERLNWLPYERGRGGIPRVSQSYRAPGFGSGSAPRSSPGR